MKKEEEKKKTKSKNLLKTPLNILTGISISKDKDLDYNIKEIRARVKG